MDKLLILSVTLLVLLEVFVLCPGLIISPDAPKVAIVGGGIGGTSCAYFLRQFFINKISLTLFEKDTIGGRLKLIEVNGKKFEAGGSIIHVRNYYMNQLIKILDLKTKKPISGRLGIYDGEQFVFKESRWYFLTIANILWRYGLSIYELQKDIGPILKDFNRVYTIQDKDLAYTTVERLLSSINPTFLNMTKTSIGNILLEKGYTPQFLDEFVKSIMMVNYGQTNDISGLAGFVSLAGAEENSLYGVDGGNKRVPEGILKFAEARVVKAAVREIELLPDKKFLVKYQDSSADQVKTETFDIIVLCTPLIRGVPNIKFVHFSSDFRKYERPYQQTVSTFVEGILRPEAFDNRVPLPEEILTNTTNLLFNSITRLGTVLKDGRSSDESIYKVFSVKPLSNDSLEKLFSTVSGVQEYIWRAYPRYRAPEKFVPFILYPNVYYANAIEQSASAMEMSIIGAKNIALLISNTLKNRNKINIVPSPALKDEL